MIMAKKSISYETRIEIIAYYKLKKYSKSEIARLSKVSRKCVFTTINNYEENGSCAEKKRLGRPRKSSKREDYRLFSLARLTPTASTRQLSNNWKRNDLRIASRQTVSRRLIEFKLESKLAVTKPLLTKVHKAKRLAWCKARRNWGYEKWASVIFSDEANYMLINRKSTPRVRRFRHEKYKDRFVKKVTQGGGGSIGVWGCIGQKGTGCSTTYPGRMDADRYINVLENNLIPSIQLLIQPNQEWLFQKDGASCHTAKSANEWFRRNNITTLPWPAKSPDLNPIEHLWILIDKKLDKNPPKTLEELEKALLKCWNELTPDEVLKYIESLPNRVDKCIKAGGGHFKY